MRENDLTVLGKRLAAATEAKGLTQADVVRATKIDKATVSKIMRGLQRPSIDQLKAIAGVLDLPHYDFLSESHAPDAAPVSPPPGLAEYLAQHGDRIAPAIRRHLERSHFVVDEGVVLDEEFWREQARIWAKRLGL